MLDIRLEQLNCLRLPRRLRRKAPYLWTVFFRIDSQGVTLSPQFELTGQAHFHFTPQSQGNLQTESIQEIGSIPIPASLGLWRTELKPIEVPFFSYQMPGILGVIAVLMQENNVSPIGAEAGHQALNEYVRDAVNAAITNFSVKAIDVENIKPSIKQYFARQVDRLADNIESEVKKAVVSAQSWTQNLWSLIDQDELIGYQVWDIMDNEIPPEGLELTHHWDHAELGAWILSGQIKRLP
ncbi:MAG: hypothetical protein AAF804_05270 [Bacteroidota bacterium]